MITLTMTTENTPKMIINNPEGTGTVKDLEKMNKLQTMNLKNLSLTFQDAQAAICTCSSFNI